jgi:hypothetical protein
MFCASADVGLPESAAYQISHPLTLRRDQSAANVNRGIGTNAAGNAAIANTQAPACASPATPTPSADLTQRIAT